MSQKELKDFIRNSGHKPIRICLADGAAYKVSHPDFAFATAESVILASGPGHEIAAEFVVCPLAHITRVEVLKRKAKAA
ncbi:MAG TPA: hypothetical protein VGK40_04620 [Verrucomicrobiae bacterium]|jgi:hypothetical protein